MSIRAYELNKSLSYILKIRKLKEKDRARIVKNKGTIWAFGKTPDVQNFSNWQHLPRLFFYNILIFSRTLLTFVIYILQINIISAEFLSTTYGCFCNPHIVGFYGR